MASPAAADNSLEMAGLIDPAIVVVAGSPVKIQLINADATSAHGMVITASGRSGSAMLMMTPRAASTGSAIWFLGDPTTAGLTPPP